MRICYLSPDPVNKFHGRQIARDRGMLFTTVEQLPRRVRLGEALVVDFDQLRPSYQLLATAPDLLFLHSYDVHETHVRLAAFGHAVHRTLVEAIDAAIEALRGPSKSPVIFLPKIFYGLIGKLDGGSRLTSENGSGN